MGGEDGSKFFLLRALLLQCLMQDQLYQTADFANNSVMDKTMALFHARNTVLRALREVEV
jgi:hypothetical protein